MGGGGGGEIPHYQCTLHHLLHLTPHHHFLPLCILLMPLSSLYSLAFSSLLSFHASSLPSLTLHPHPATLLPLTHPAFSSCYSPPPPPPPPPSPSLTLHPHPATLLPSHTSSLPSLTLHPHPATLLPLPHFLSPLPASSSSYSLPLPRFLSPLTHPAFSSC